MMTKAAPMLRAFNDGTTPLGVGRPPVGALAYWDSMVAGPVPVKVLRVEEDANYPGLHAVHFVITANRGVYDRGEVHQDSLRNVIPRKALVKRGAFYRIQSYSWGQ
jgi:hypothetical protein